MSLFRSYVIYKYVIYKYVIYKYVVNGDLPFSPITIGTLLASLVLSKSIDFLIGDSVVIIVTARIMHHNSPMIYIVRCIQKKSYWDLFIVFDFSEKSRRGRQNLCPDRLRIGRTKSDELSSKNREQNCASPQCDL